MTIGRYSSLDIDTLAFPYRARLLNEESVRVERRTAEAFFGEIQYVDVSVDLNNADGALTPYHLADPAGRPISLTFWDLIGGVGMTEFSGVISETKANPGRITVRATNLDLGIFETLIPKGLVTVEEFPQAIDVGKTKQFIVGNRNKVPCWYIKEDFAAGEFDYLIGYGSIAVSEMFVNWTDNSFWTINPSDYTVSTSLYPGYTVARFTKPQVDYSGGRHTVWANVSGLSAERNPIRSIRTLMNSVVFGLGKDIDTDSFDLGESQIPLGLEVDFALVEQVPARQVLRELMMLRGARLVVRPSSAYGILVDAPTAEVYMDIRDGGGDGALNLIEASDFGRVPVSDRVKTVTVRYGHDFPSGDRLYNQSRIVNANVGQDKTVELFLVQEHLAADIFTDYYGKKLWYSEDVGTLTVSPEGRFLPEGRRVRITYAPIGLNQKIMETRSVEKDTRSPRVYVRGTSSSIFTYTPGTLPDDRQDPANLDFSRTVPADVTGLAVIGGGPELGNDGTVVGFSLLQFTTPIGTTEASLAYHSARVDIQRSGQTHWHVGYVGPIIGAGIKEVKVSGLVPGILYNYRVVSLTLLGVPSLGVTLTDQLAPGDVTAPSAPTGVTPRQGAGKSVEVDLSFTEPEDWGDCLLYVNTSNNPNTASLVAKGKQRRFTYFAVTYGQTLFFWGKVRDNTAVAGGQTSGPNVSGFSPSSGNSITVTQVQTGDVEDGAISTPKIPAGAVSQALTGGGVGPVALSGSYQTLAIGVISVFGGTVLIHADGFLQWSGGGITAICNVRIRRVGGPSTSGTSVSMPSGTSSVAVPFHVHMVDTPPAGSVTYVIEGIRGSGSDNVLGFVQVASLLEFKR